MTDLYLEAGEDHVERLAHENDPVRAVVELIWNAVDAEATEIDVVLEKDQWDAVTKVAVTDNGHGIDREDLASTFGRIGGSWKRLTAKTKNGKRGLHGKRGEGRLRAFALGCRVAWVSYSVDVTGQLQRVEITGSTSRRHVFPTDSKPAAGVPTGTTVTAWNDSQRSLAVLETSQTLSVLRSHFAPVLMNDDDLVITYNGIALDPSDEIVHSTDIPLVFFDDSGTEHQAHLRIITWRSGSHRAIYYGQDGEHFLYEESAKDVESQYRYSAYVTWDGFDDEALATIGLGDMATGPVGTLWTTARDGIRQYFSGRRRETRREQVTKWKKNKVYPYKGEPQTEPERAERAVFDVVSGALSPQIPSKNSDARLALALLRDALQSDPEKLTTIIHEVAALNPADRDTLTRLLSETTLTAIIKAANLVTSRNKFLTGLEHLLFDPADASKIGERDHLHRILEHELWIFGEGYHVMNSERGLTEMLRTHLKLEGLPVKGIDAVRRWDGKTGRVDLHLAAKAQEFDRTRHLVVELKAPDITLGRTELDQVEDYANVVLSNPAFATEKAEWDFVLVGTDLNDVARRRVIDSDFEVGQFWGPEPEPGQPRVRAYVRRWRNVLDENRRRLAFMTTNLEHDPTLEEGLGHIREHYRDLLPPEVSDGGSDDVPDESEATPAS